jgi:hypothetical protein
MSSPPAGDTLSTLRVALHTLTCNRSDGHVEDDFKTWAQVVWLGPDGVPNDASWYATGDDALLARTSITNGSEGAAYNYVRLSKALPLTEDAVSELVASSLLVRGRLLRPCVVPRCLRAHRLRSPPFHHRTRRRSTHAHDTRATPHHTAPHHTTGRCSFTRAARATPQRTRCWAFSPWSLRG